MAVTSFQEWFKPISETYGSLVDSELLLALEFAFNEKVADEFGPEFLAPIIVARSHALRGNAYPNQTT